jgi:hypothetical protein
VSGGKFEGYVCFNQFLALLLLFYEVDSPKGLIAMMACKFDQHTNTMRQRGNRIRSRHAAAKSNRVTSFPFYGSAPKVGEKEGTSQRVVEVGRAMRLCAVAG